MAKVPQTAIERKAKASVIVNGSKVIRRAMPSREFLESKKWKRIRNMLLFILALELFLFSLAVPSGDILEDAQETYVEESTDDEYDFL